MKVFILVSALIILSIARIAAQDTIFQKIEKDYQITFTKSGYHIYALIQDRYKLIDTVFRYDYGAYMGTKIKDAALFDNVFICIYDGGDGMFFSNHKLEMKNWSPIVGGYFFFFSQGEKNDYLVSILSKEKVEVSKGVKKVIYLFDHIKKTVSVSKD